VTVTQASLDALAAHTRKRGDTVPAPLPMPTRLDPAATTRPDDAPRVPRRRPAPINWIRLAIPAAIATTGTLWYLGAGIAVPAELVTR
jgi:hypothetical protein